MPPSAPLTAEQAAQLLASIDGLTGQVAELHVEVADARRAREADDRTRAEENASRDRSAKWLQRLAIGALIAAAIGIGVGAAGFSAADKADRKADIATARADAILEARTTSRKIACDEFNEQQARSRAGEKAQVRSVISDRPRTPEEQAQIDELLRRHDAQVDASYPDRDCSPDGIAAYYEETP